MKFTETALKGAYLVEIERFEDERGFFGRTFCSKEFEAHGLNPALVQCSTSYNTKASTLRGMHYQAAPFEEAKLVRCTMGALFDAIVDLRPKSQTYRQWVGTELTAENHLAVYIPAGFAHGFLTLADNTEIFYQMSQYWSLPHGRGVRWDDPAFQIKWPGKPTIMSGKDAAYPNFTSLTP